MNSPPSTPPRSQPRSLPSSPDSPPSSRRRTSHSPSSLRTIADVAFFVRKLTLPSSPTPSAQQATDFTLSSGPSPLSHPSLLPPSTSTSTHAGCQDAGMDADDGIVARADSHVVHTEHFLCAHAVDATILLRAARATLLARVKLCGADALLDERWVCRIRGAKHGTYRVHVEYSACPARTGRPDPGRPVALANARGGVPGLMTILERS